MEEELQTKMETSNLQLGHDDIELMVHTCPDW